MALKLATFLNREQKAYLRRDRSLWAGHLSRIRGFLGEGLQTARKDAEVLVLGAGSGLEVPWELAPPGTVGWDADPTSRLRTLLRHRRWAPWVFEDVTSAFGGLNEVLFRALGHPWSGRRRTPEMAVVRLAGLLPSLRPEAIALRTWVQHHRPGTILTANFMGQLGVVAAGMVEAAFAPWEPWEEDPEVLDPLAEALDDWVERVLRALLAELRESGADLWLVHDRGILHGQEAVRLGPPAEPWTAQLPSLGEVEVSDPLVGVDVRALLAVERVERWLWPVGPGQTHVMEAVWAPGRGLGISA